MAKPQPPATDSAPIDWPRLLIGRPSPPPGWWVDLAIQRQCGTVELRASAVAALLAPPLMLRLGPPPYLPQIPALAEEWIGILNQQDAHLALGGKGFDMAIEALQTAVAARDVLQDPKQADLVPELQRLCGVAADLVETLQAAGADLKSTACPLTSKEQEQLLLAALPAGSTFKPKPKPIRRPHSPGGFNGQRERWAGLI